MQRETFTLTLVSARMVTPTVRHLEFSLPKEASFHFIPGQFITFHFENEGVLHQRSYSIATIPSQTPNIEIAVSPYEGGPGTKLLFGMQPGDTINTTGPFGRLVLKEETLKRYILVATGTGVTPYRSMLPLLSQRMAKEPLQVVVLLGVQRKPDLLYGEDFIDFAKTHENFQFFAYYSRELPENPLFFERQGYVQHAFQTLDLNPNEDVVYLCGNPNMIDESFEWLREAGFQTSQVRREKYISPKR